ERLSRCLEDLRRQHARTGAEVVYAVRHGAGEYGPDSGRATSSCGLRPGKDRASKRGAFFAELMGLSPPAAVASIRPVAAQGWFGGLRGLRGVRGEGRRSLLSLAAAYGLLLVTGGCGGGADTGDIQVTVKDVSMAAVPGAQVTTEPATVTLTTDARG